VTVGVRSTTGDWHVCRCLVVCCRRVALQCEPVCAISAVVVSSASTNSPRVCRRSPGWPHLHVCLLAPSRPACRELTVSSRLPNQPQRFPCNHGAHACTGQGYLTIRSTLRQGRTGGKSSNAPHPAMSPSLPPSLIRRRGSCKPVALESSLSSQINLTKETLMSCSSSARASTRTFAHRTSIECDCVASYTLTLFRRSHAHTHTHRLTWRPLSPSLASAVAQEPVHIR
jgi:hypothetical protein